MLKMAVCMLEIWKYCEYASWLRKNGLSSQFYGTNIFKLIIS